jgi:polysaccharide export outer membrane protein
MRRVVTVRFGRFGAVLVAASCAVLVGGARMASGADDAQAPALGRLPTAPPPSPRTTPSPEPASAAVDPSTYKIGPEDTLAIAVWQNTDLTRTVPVRPDGKISLPLVHDVQAAGLTPMELRDQLKEKLAEYAPGAEISVIVAEVNSFKVSVMGKVQRPDRYLLKGPTTVLDVLALAGGFQDFANQERVVVLRPEPFFVQGKPSGQTFRRFYLNYKKIIAAGGETDNFALQAGDIVVVP